MSNSISQMKQLRWNKQKNPTEIHTTEQNQEETENLNKPVTNKEI